LIAELFKEYPTAFAFSISRMLILKYMTIVLIAFSHFIDTTRSPRSGEQNGRGMLSCFN
jgi:hypothetical protein